ncbi:hypothetical protein [Brucella intermedia]|uniref:hypothetical protein n=1 Tax=Brucella intermedia TaxID=94625 RepID=UPI0004689CF0|nr:hypothetical protein [Brucella intermedia]
MALVEALGAHLYPYFVDGFESETFELREAEINGTRIAYKINFHALDRFNLPFLLLDRATQCLGFQSCSYLLAQQGRTFRFLFLKSINWKFMRPIRPNRPVVVDAQYSYVVKDNRKACFAYSGIINRSCAEFEIGIDVFLS